MKFKWENIWDNHGEMDNIFMTTSRSKVIGGWLVRHEMVKFDSDDDSDDWANCHNTMIFISDPDHKWEIDYD